MYLKALMVSVAVFFAGGISAADVPWPTDFWNQVTNSVTATRTASGTLTRTATLGSSFTSVASTKNEGMIEGFFDSWYKALCTSDGINFNTLPLGAFMVIR